MRAMKNNKMRRPWPRKVRGHFASPSSNISVNFVIVDLSMASSIQSIVDSVPWDLLGGIVLAHCLLTWTSYLAVGSQRNKAAVMGKGDNSKTKAAMNNGSYLCTILAYNILAVCYASYCSYTGTKAWFDGTTDKVGGTLQDRFYSYSAPYASIARLTIAYEIYNTLAVLVHPEYRNFAFIFHHTTCLILGIMSLAPFCHYYATFFFGLTAISSVPLALIELCQAAEAPAAVEASRVAFCVAFLIFRTVYWLSLIHI